MVHRDLFVKIDVERSDEQSRSKEFRDPMRLGRSCELRANGVHTDGVSVLWPVEILGEKQKQPHFESDSLLARIRKRGGVQKSMGNKVPWKTGVPIYLPVTSRPLISLQKEAVLHPCNFATTHLTARILNFYLP